MGAIPLVGLIWIWLHRWPMPKATPVACRGESVTVDRAFAKAERELQIPPLRSPGFPMETRGVDALHAARFTASRTRGPC
jgi:hypothetical protein